MRQLYVTALRTLTVSTLLAISITVTAQNYLLWMPNYQR